MTDENSRINEALKAALASAVEACVSSATQAETCVHADNPEWHSVARVLDECTDRLREAENTLQGSKP